MSNELPLYYAIMKHFANGKPDCTEGVMHDLAASYSTYKLFTRKDIDEALATAKENGLLDERDWEIGNDGQLRTFYVANEFGKDMIARYID